MAVTSYVPKNGYRPCPMEPCTNQQPYSPFYAQPTFQQPLPQLYTMTNQSLAAMAGYTDPVMVRWKIHIHTQAQNLSCRHKRSLSLVSLLFCPADGVILWLHGWLPRIPQLQAIPLTQTQVIHSSLTFSFWRDISLLLPSYHSLALSLFVSLPFCVLLDDGSMFVVTLW